MALVTGSDSYEYEVAPEVTVLWAVAVFKVLPDGTELERETHQVPTRAAAESVIDDRITAEPSQVTRIKSSMWRTHASFDDGSEIDFWILLDVTDFRCLDCRLDMRTIDEYYLLHDELWLGIVPDRIGHLCIGCVEERLGRRLTPHDFQPGRASLDGRYSERLRDRTGEAERGSIPDDEI